MLLTPKQEKFCQNIIKGMNQADAYRGAYSSKNMKDETIWSNASRLYADSKVLARIGYLRAKIEDKLVYSAKQSFDKLKDIQDKAIANERLSEAIKAEELKGKLAGLYVEKQEFVGGNVKTVLVEFVKNGDNREDGQGIDTSSVCSVDDTEVED